VYHGPGRKAWEDVADPKIIDATDVLVQVDATTICGTDLHILKGDVPAVESGRVLGHEAVATIVEAGSAVAQFKAGDRVIVPAITSCGRCTYCRARMPSHCQSVGGIGWIFGHLIDGLQAEYARVPFADTSLHQVPEGVTDEQVLFLADILPTGYEIGVRDGRVKPGDVVAVVGAGPIGLAAIMTAGLHGASRIIAIDLADSRLEHAKNFGADYAINGSDPNLKEQVLGLTDGLGVDVAMEAVGVPATFATCLELVRPGGHVSNIGVHGTGVNLPLDSMWIHNVTISTGLVNGVTIPILLNLIRDGKLPAEKYATHRFALGDMMEAYDVFANAAETNALKVVLSR
jgi:alcohol dehydrogenase